MASGLDVIASPGTESLGYPMPWQVYDWVPSVAPLYPEWWAYEREFDGNAASDDLKEWYLPLLAVVLPLYLLGVFGGKAVMANRKAFDLKTPLLVWNIFLALFSTAGFLRIFPHFILTLVDRGLYFSMCAQPAHSFGNGPSGLWTYLFILSKVPELIDTAFIVLRKKKLIFLHWYHHVTVLSFSLHVYAYRESPGLYWAGMNFLVHALMYSYYALTALGFRPPWALAITLLQIAQMIVGLIVSGFVVYYKYVAQRECNHTYHSLAMSIAIYGSYFILFVSFFVKRYLYPSKKKSVKKTQ